jgi:MmyB-like transcription regulator ligand binding domain
LAGLADLTEHLPAPAAERAQRLVDSLMPNVASVYDGHFDFVAWNLAYACIRTDPAELPPDRRNLLWWMFTDHRNRAMMRDWEPAARAILSQFRAAAGRRPDDQRLTAVITALGAASPEFRAWWQEYPVNEFRPAAIGLSHPTAGELDLQLYQLRMVEDPDLLLVLQLPATDEDRGRIAATLDRARPAPRILPVPRDVRM